MEPSSFKESTPTSIPPSSRAVPRKSRKLGGLFRRISTEWNSFILKVKALSDAALSEDEAVEDLFDSSEGDTFERFQRGTTRRYTEQEQQFLREYKHYKSLDKVFESQRRPPTMTLASLDELDSQKITFRDLDMVKLRDDMETRVKTVTVLSDTSTDSSRPASSYESANKPNIGETLWEFRRSKWLAAPDGKDVAAKIEELRDNLPIKSIPKELYPRVYSSFVEKSRPLKADVRINLEDLINIINAGWVREEKWERAAKGLA